MSISRYNKTRTLFESVFGQKFHEQFPRRYLLSKPCGNGFWKSNGKGRYEHYGIDLEVSIKQEVGRLDNNCLPF